MNQPNPAPYPADTRAKGWRFELNYEQIEQSDTWDIAAEIPMAQHSLLMMWYVAWKQEPCGTLPCDEATIRAKCKLSPKSWAAMRHVLMRGWWLADDGRMYHPTVTARVLEMLEYRRKNAKRVADFKAKMREQRSGNALPTQQQQDNNDTGTGTGTGTIDVDVLPPSQAGEADEVDTAGFSPTPAGVVCKALKQAGIASVNPSNQTLLTLLDAGATLEEFIAAADKAGDKSRPFEYLLTVVQNERQRVKAMAGTLHQGAMPQKAPSAAELRVLQAVPGIAAPHLRQPQPFTEEVFDAPAKLLG